MDLDQIYFSNLKKFDEKIKKIKFIEIGQIAGRAGRYLNTEPLVLRVNVKK